MKYNFKLNVRLSELSNLRAQMEDIFEEEMLFNDITRKNILLALTELFVNVYKHGGQCEKCVVAFDVNKRDTGLEITMYDQGNSYDPFRLAPPDISKLPESGYGVFLVKSLMDSFEYYPKNEKPDSFNTTKIIKYA